MKGKFRIAKRLRGWSGVTK